MSESVQDSDSGASSFSSRMTEQDWQDIMESEFVDFTESAMGTKIGFVFEHDELGLHGFQFERNSATIKPCSYNVQGVNDE